MKEHWFLIRRKQTIRCISTMIEVAGSNTCAVQVGGISHLVFFVPGQCLPAPTNFASPRERRIELKRHPPALTALQICVCTARLCPARDHKPRCQQQLRTFVSEKVFES
jgi:hypothetical protein